MMYYIVSALLIAGTQAFKIGYMDMQKFKDIHSNICITRNHYMVDMEYCKNDGKISLRDVSLKK